MYSSRAEATADPGRWDHYQVWSPTESGRPTNGLASQSIEIASQAEQINMAQHTLVARGSGSTPSRRGT